MNIQLNNQQFQDKTTSIYSLIREMCSYWGSFLTFNSTPYPYIHFIKRGGTKQLKDKRKSVEEQNLFQSPIMHPLSFQQILGLLRNSKQNDPSKLTIGESMVYRQKYMERGLNKDTKEELVFKTTKRHV